MWDFQRKWRKYVQNTGLAATLKSGVRGRAGRPWGSWSAAASRRFRIFGTSAARRRGGL